MHRIFFKYLIAEEGTPTYRKLLPPVKKMEVDFGKENKLFMQL